MHQKQQVRKRAENAHELMNFKWVELAVLYESYSTATFVIEHSFVLYG